ncbi:MAG: prenyltransferase [Methanomassiliicoccaceae archaeon]|jgi:1,4-dihydroxy-2-naphthoate octaprenyltransferase|nr:prenyltransferase [Methanomassiliicoccaceae archaeon]
MSNNADNVSLMRRINLIFRFSYTLPFFTASLCGSLFAYLFYQPPVHIVILMPLVVLLLAVFVNFSNDYFDHRSGVDKIRFEKKEEMAKAMIDTKLLRAIYWEGNPFDNGLITDRQGKMVMALLVIISVMMAIPIVLHGGLMVMIFGAAGLFLSYFYTAPPLDLGARGLGEIDVALSFFMLVFCSFYVGTINFADTGSVLFSYDILGTHVLGLAFGIFDLKIFVFAIIIGTLVGLMRLTDSMSGQEAHIARGEKSIAVRFGLDGAVKIAKAFILFSYVLFAAMAYFNPAYLLLFLVLPLSLKAWKVMTKKGDNWPMLCPPLFFGTAFMTEILFVVSVVIIKVFEVQPLF